jgi:hypothetical protein
MINKVGQFLELILLTIHAQSCYGWCAIMGKDVPCGIAIEEIAVVLNLALK